MVEVKKLNMMRVVSVDRGELGITLDLATQEGRHALFVRSQDVRSVVDALQNLDGPDNMTKTRVFLSDGHKVGRTLDGAPTLEIQTKEAGSFSFTFPPEAIPMLIEAFRKLREE